MVRAGRALTAIEVKGARPRDARPGLAAFCEAFKSKRALLMGSDGVAVEEFLAHPVQRWIKA